MPVAIIKTAPPPLVGTGRAKAASEQGPTTYRVESASAQWGGPLSVKVGVSEPATAPTASAADEEQAPPRKRSRSSKPPETSQR